MPRIFRKRATTVSAARNAGMLRSPAPGALPSLLHRGSLRHCSHELPWPEKTCVTKGRCLFTGVPVALTSVATSERVRHSLKVDCRRTNGPPSQTDPALIAQRLPAPDGPRAIQEVNPRLSCRVRDVSTLGGQARRRYKFPVDAIDQKANEWFEWTRSHAAKVRNVSKVGSHRLWLRHVERAADPGWTLKVWYAREDPNLCPCSEGKW